MLKARKLPLRMCLGCQQMKPKKELIRVVKNQAGEVSLDFKGKKPGRGAYICNHMDCFRKARKGRRFEKALSHSIPEEIMDILQEELDKEQKP